MRLTRGEFLRAAAGAATVAALPGRAYGATARPAAGPLHFRSRPDLLPPVVNITPVAGAAAPAPGYSFLGPTGSHGSQAGPLIVDATGQPVWFRPLGGGQLAANIRVQSYRGRPVLTWWQGTVTAGYGQGEGVILDTSYREIARVRAARGRQVDMHEFLLTPQGTALVTCFPDWVPADLTEVNGPRAGHVLDSIIQEIDVASGRLLLEWRSLDHVALSESHASPWDGFDFFHANSIDLTPDGNLLVSARHTWALYKVARRTGRVLWRLGGKRSSFAMAPGARFAWQHDARHPPGSAITVFDDGAGPQKTESQSRGLLLELDLPRRRVTLTRSYRHPHPLLASAMGNMQTLPDGHVVIGWGSLPWMTEFDAEGNMLSDLRLPWGCQSYRGLRFPWQASAPGAPALVAVAGVGAGAGESTLYASWNGATDLAAWQVRTGPSPSALSPAGVAPRQGFETAVPVGSASGYAAVAALTASGEVLGTSRPVRL